MGGRAVGREREEIFSERKQKWDIHWARLPSRSEDAAMRKVAPREAGNAVTTSDERGSTGLAPPLPPIPATPASFVSGMVRSGGQLLCNGLERLS